MNCDVCDEEMYDESYDEGFETPNYAFHLCLKCATNVEDEIYTIIKKRAKNEPRNST